MLPGLRRASSHVRLDQFGGAAADHDDGALVPGPEMIDGMTEASATRSPRTPWTRSSLSTTASASVPIRAVPTGCPKLAEAVLCEIDQILPAPACGPGMSSASRIRRTLLVSQFPRGLDSRTIALKIVVRAEMVPLDHGRDRASCARQALPARGSWAEPAPARS